MNPASTRRSFLRAAAVGIGATGWTRSQAEDAPPPVTRQAGDLQAIFRDNAQSPAMLSGLDSLFNQRDAPDFDAFDPDSRGASAGLNFEHIISGHESRYNAFTPRQGPFVMTVLPDERSVQITRKREDDPWAMSSTIKYTLVVPHYVDVDFRCVPHDASLFGARGYGILFFANYMNDVEDVALHFRGVAGADMAEQWIRADAPSGHPHWNQGGTYRAQQAKDLEYDTDQKFVLNSWSYDEPRYTQPFYYGRAARRMTLIMMFDRSATTVDEIRFSLFKFKLPKFPRPAWDFQYVIRHIEAEREYGFRARIAWKEFVSSADCQDEYNRWRMTIDG